MGLNFSTMNALIITLRRSMFRPGAGYQRWLINLFLLITVSACEQTNGTLPPPPTATMPMGTVVGNTPAVTPSALPTTVPDRQLLLWVPPFFAERAEEEAATAMTDVYAQFERAHPGVHIELQFKNEGGDASMLNYLRHAQRLAPTILPDLILLDTQQLWQVADLELVQPIAVNQFITPTDFFPFTIAAATYDETLLGIPYATDLIHLVYDKELVETPPVRWDELLTLGTPYRFAMGRNEGLNEAVLTQYLGAGGVFTTEAIADNAEALTTLFTFAAAATRAGVVTEEVLSLTTQEQVWERFTTDPTGFAYTSARAMLSQPDSLVGNNIGYGHIPTSTGGGQTVGHVWAFAIVTADPEQVQLAIDLINLLLEPTVHSLWAQEVKYIPASPTAFESWRTASAYYDFLRTELDLAVALPNRRRYTDFSKRLQQGYEKVLRGEMTPAEAVAYVQAVP